MRWSAGIFSLPVTPEVRQYSHWFLWLGLLTMLIGMAAIIFPFLATLATELMIGSVLLVSGVFAIVHTFRTRLWNGFFLSLLMALLSITAGILLLLYPWEGIVTLTLFVAAFFFAGGLLRILLAVRLRPQDHWLWLLLSGLLSLFLSALILFGWPGTATWFIGVLVGIDLIFAGWTSIILGMSARQSA